MPMNNSDVNSPGYRLLKQMRKKKLGQQLRALSRMTHFKSKKKQLQIKKIASSGFYFEYIDCVSKKRKKRTVIIKPNKIFLKFHKRLLSFTIFDKKCM